MRQKQALKLVKQQKNPYSIFLILIHPSRTVQSLENLDIWLSLILKLQIKSYISLFTETSNVHGLN